MIVESIRFPVSCFLLFQRHVVNQLVGYERYSAKKKKKNHFQERSFKVASISSHFKTCLNLHEVSLVVHTLINTKNYSVPVFLHSVLDNSSREKLERLVIVF